MKILDPGHKYEVFGYDGGEVQTITFMKREGPGYPGNVGHYGGTNLQEVIRVLINRMKYLNTQIECDENLYNLRLLRNTLVNLEFRAAARHGVDMMLSKYWNPEEDKPELIDTCKTCGHFLYLPIHNHET